MQYEVNGTGNPNPQYHRARLWQIILFAFNNTSTNIYLFGFSFVTFYSTGLVGVAAIFISQLMGFVRVFDGFIDPALGALIDKTFTKFGKYRPNMLIGNFISAISFLILFTTHLMPQFWRIPVLIIALIIHKVGYSLQATVTKAAQASLTSDPKQRPLFNVADGIFGIILAVGGQMLVSTYLVPLYGGFTVEFFRIFITSIIIISAILCVLAVIGISGKDKKEYYGIGEGTVATSLSDYWKVIKSNKPLKSLAVASAFVKFVLQMISDQVLLVILFGVIFGDYGLSGKITLILLVPDLLFTIISSKIAGMKGFKKVYTWLIRVGILFFAFLGILIYQGQPGDLVLSFNGLTLYSVLFIIVYAIARGMARTPASLALTMAADVSDYETSRSGRFVSGMFGTIFSLTDSVSTSFSPMVIGWVLAAFGFANVYPTAETPLTPEIKIIAVSLLAILPIFALTVGLFIMRFYKLDKETMEEVQVKITEMKKENDGDNEGLSQIETPIPSYSE